MWRNEPSISSRKRINAILFEVNIYTNLYLHVKVMIAIYIRDREKDAHSARGHIFLSADTAGELSINDGKTDYNHRSMQAYIKSCPYDLHNGWILQELLGNQQQYGLSLRRATRGA